MEFLLASRPFKLTPALRDHLLHQLVVPLLRKAAQGELLSVSVQLGKSTIGAAYSCHVRVSLPRARELEVTQTAGDIYETIDLAKRQLLYALARFRDAQVASRRLHRTRTRLLTHGPARH